MKPVLWYGLGWFVSPRYADGKIAYSRTFPGTLTGGYRTLPEAFEAACHAVAAEPS